MKRYCQVLDLKDDPKLIEEYIFWHKPENIWPEIVQGLREVGIINMEIYRFGNRLFMIVDVPDAFDYEKQMTRLAALPRQAEWEEFVSKFRKSAPDATSDEKWQMTDKIFDLSQ